MKNFRAGNIEVMGDDFPAKMTWQDAVRKTREPDFKNEGWRLPLIEELEYLYSLHRSNIGNFKDQWYWAISSYDERYKYWKDDYVLSFRIPIWYGQTLDYLTSNNYSFRLVRDLDSENKIKAFERIDVVYKAKL